MNVHFILLDDHLRPGDTRALRSAVVHDAEIILWHASQVPPLVPSNLNVHVRRIDVPAWVNDNEQLAHVFDLLAYKVANEHGGLVLGLDTISIRSAWDLLTHDVVFSTDWPSEDWPVRPDPYNNNFLAKAYSKGTAMLTNQAEWLMRHRQIKEWGYTGPLMLTSMVQNYPQFFGAAPYPTLCGWAPGYIWKFYLGLQRPAEDVRVIHLCRSAYLDLYEGRPIEWAEKNPKFAADVANRTDLNADLLAL